MPDRLSRAICATGLFLVSVPASAGIPVDLQAERRAASGDASYSMAVADFDEDGRLDVAVANDVPNTLTILLGDGRGGFAAPRVFTGTNRPGKVTAADFNGDGHVDLATTEQFNHAIYVTLGDGHGHFLPGTRTSIGEYPQAIVTGDFNEDGHVDAVVIGRDQQRILFLQGDGQGGLGAPLVLLSFINSSCLAAGDLDHDGHLDLIAGRASPIGVAVLMGRGDGSFVVTPGAGLPTAPTQIALGDLDSDGSLDLVAGADKVYALHGDGLGGFGPAAGYTSGKVYDLRLADFDADGRLDVVTEDRDNSVVNVLIGTGGGALGPPSAFPTGVWPFGLETGDFNEDGRIDVATSNYVDDVTVLLGDGRGHLPAETRAGSTASLYSVAAADFDGDGRLDLAMGRSDVVVWKGDGAGWFGTQTAYGAGDQVHVLATGDFDNDGFVDVVTGNQAYAYIDFPPPPTLSVLLGNGLGALQLHTRFTLNLIYYPGAVAVADLNGDGNLDVVVGPSNSDRTAYVYKGNGSGSFNASASFFSVSAAVTSMALEDFDGDGDIDIATPFALYRNDSVGHFSLAATLPVLSPAAVLSRDFNDDGRPDLAVVTTQGSVAILLNAGGGVFPSATYFAGDDSGATLATADFNNDGFLDLGVGSRYNGRAAVLEGRGDGSFGPARIFGSAGVIGVVAADFDTNGSPDLLGMDESTVTMMLNRTPSIRLDVDSAGLYWTPVGTALGFDVVRGGLRALAAARGDFGAAGIACLGDDIAGRFLADVDVPPADDGFYYLARAEMPVGSGTYDSGDPAQAAPRDAPISASPLACP